MIACVAAMNFALLYKYILMKRNRTMAVFQITGLTRSKAAAQYLGECMILLLIFIPLSFGIFQKGLLPGLEKVYKGFEEFYTTDIYLKFGIGYFGISMLILGGVIIYEIGHRSLLERL